MHEPPNCDALLGEGVQRLVDTLARLTRSRLRSAGLDSDDDAWREVQCAADSSAARAICLRFPGPQRVCGDWQRQVRDHAADECDPHGLSLCVEAVDALGVVVNDVRIIDASHDLDHAPLDLDRVTNAGDPSESFAQTVTDLTWEISDTSTTRSPRKSRQLLLSCSRALSDCDDCDDGTATTRAAGVQPQKVADARILVMEVRLALGRRPWATAGDIVNLGSGAIIGLRCTLVCGLTFGAYDQVGFDTMLVQRRLLADFLRAPADGTWPTFAQRRYANLQRLPEALVARGWSTKDARAAPWLWGRATAPGAETHTDGPALCIKRPDLPHPMSLVFSNGRLLLVPHKCHFLDHVGFDWPTFFPSDATATAIYGNLCASPLHQCDPLCIGNDHKDKVVALQREKLVGMGLVSPSVVSGRDGPFCERDANKSEGNPEFMHSFDSASRALVDTDPATLAASIDAHIAQSVFAEYGPVDGLTGGRLNGHLCDHLAREAIDSRRLWSDLTYVNGAHFTATEGVVDPPSDDQLADPLHRPRLVVNWQPKFTPLHNTTPRNRANRFRMTVWAIVVTQSDGYGGACVVVRLSKAAVKRVRKSNDGHLWRGLIDKCARGNPDYPPGLHPAVVVAADLERACGKRGCVVPWAYHTGGVDGHSADVRSLTTWVLDRVADIFAAFDAQLSRRVADARRDGVGGAT
ncbi:hypothetical protein pneo_cds_626 [Pandoravirus neocaledonia]|uniref:Uncharacterized protein n=1 Tax=Pandoravirus neocaledonia TaxID=2107708 RepID=A0A2U7UCR8_9VIRU|nr:hypothetical protein pneo_cds_626 [Pandoravirus neocaledonia]AVK76233.1 hypothetical protein pneo_cds_626 [Pandoravirus neocaledonia]